jgi:hypothetical protein
LENKKNISNRFLRFDDENILKSFLQNLLVVFYNKKSILDSRKDVLIREINKSFPGYDSATIKVVERLDYLSKNEPKIIYEIVLEYFQDKALLTKLIDVARKANNADCNDLVYQMEFIADFYEIVEVFQLFAALFRANSDTTFITKDKNSILKQLKNFGLSTKEIENIRLIRNSAKHKFLIQDSCLITEKNEKIPIRDINSLFYSIDTLISWLITFNLRASILIPRFSFIVIMTFYTDTDKNDQIWEEHLNGLKVLYQGLFNKIKQENEKETKSKSKLQIRIKKIRRKIKYFFKYRLTLKRKKVPDKLPDAVNCILSNTDFHFSQLKRDIDEMHDKINDKDLQSKIEQLTRWIERKDLEFNEFKRYYENNTEKLINDFKRNYR